MTNQDNLDLLEQAVLRAGFEAGERILVGVSGGPDSVALLDTLSRLASRPEQGWSLRVAHVNHGLRGPESDQDERFVCDLASSLGLDIDVINVEPSAHRKPSPEAAARAQRYAGLREALARWPGDVLVTGHTLNDQAETVVLRLLRGTGLVGLGGIKPRSHELVRPLLGIRREQILGVLQDRGLGYRLDSTNLDPRFERNRIRAKVMPALDSVQPRAANLIGRAAALLQTDADFVLNEALAAREHLAPTMVASAVSARLSVWRSLHPSIRSHVLRLLVWDVLGADHPLDESHVALLCSTLERDHDCVIKSQLPHGLTLEVFGAHFTLRVGTPLRAAIPQPVRLEVPGHVAWCNGEIKAELLSAVGSEEIDRLQVVCGPNHALCDARAVGNFLLVRARRAGDRMRPLGMTGTRKLQDLMVDRRVPRDIRDLVPVVTFSGIIVWVPGVGLDARAALTDTTRTILHLTSLSLT